MFLVVTVRNGHVTHKSSLTFFSTQTLLFFLLLFGVSLTCDCRTGDTIAMCSCMIGVSLSVSERSPHARRLIELIKACASSPPCSPRRSKPSPVLCIKSTQCISKICCLGEMRVPGNLLLKLKRHVLINGVLHVFCVTPFFCQGLRVRQLRMDNNIQKV